MVSSKIEINGNVIELYSSYENLPMERYNKFNKFVMKASDIGDDIPSFISHISKSIELIGLDCKEQAIQELQNLSYSVLAVFNEYSISQNALACMIKSINGVERNDLTDEGLEETIKMLSDAGITQEMVLSNIDGLKKK